MFTYIEFWFRMIGCALTGNRRYYCWIGFLLVLVLAGVVAYIANFTYLVGIAAAAVLLVFPSYIYHKQEMKEVVLLGELLAVSAMIMCLLFIAVDLGRIDRFWHIIPFIGKLNFPYSILAWDVVVLNVYLLLNLHIPGYLLYRKYLKKDPGGRHYLPFVYISIIWAISIHTVTAFLYSGIGGPGYWNSAILAPILF